MEKDFLTKTIGKVCRLFFKNISEKNEEAIIQFVKFGIVGATNTLISYVLYVGSLLLLQKGDILQNVDMYIAQIISFVLSVLWSFYWNNRFVFSGNNNIWWKKLLKTYVSYSFTGLFLSAVLLYFWVNILGVSEYLAPIINLVITVPLNFVMNKFWAFKNKENDDRKEEEK